MVPQIDCVSHKVDKTLPSPSPLPKKVRKHWQIVLSWISRFLSLPVHIARWALMHHFLSVHPSLDWNWNRNLLIAFRVMHVTIFFFNINVIHIGSVNEWPLGKNSNFSWLESKIKRECHQCYLIWLIFLCNNQCNC